MNKMEKNKAVLINYRKVHEIKKTKVLKAIRDLDLYKLKLQSTLDVLYGYLGTRLAKNSLFDPTTLQNKRKSTLELFVLNPNTNSIRMLELIHEMASTKHKLITVIYVEGSLKPETIKNLKKIKTIELLPVSMIQTNDIGQIITFIMKVADAYMNNLKSVSAVYMSSNLLAFEIKRMQIAPITDDKLDLKKNQMSNATVRKVESFVPTYSRWVQNMYEKYIWLKLRKTFVDFEVAMQMQEMLRINKSLDIINEKIEEIEHQLRSEKIKDSSDELSILQGGDQYDY